MVSPIHEVDPNPDVGPPVDWGDPAISKLACIPLRVLTGVALACAGDPPPDPTGSFAVQCERAENAIRHGRLDNAERFLAPARKLAAVAGRRSPEQARVNLALAGLRRAQGNHQQARHYLALARFATRAAHGERSLEMAGVETESAIQHQRVELHDQAVAAIQKALEIRSALLGPQDPLVQETTRTLAWAYQLAFRYPRAVETYEGILAAMDEHGDTPVQDQVIVLNRLAWIHERAALPEKARAYRDRARETVRARMTGRGTSPRLLELGLDALASLEDGRREEMVEMKTFAREWIEDHRYHPEHFSFERQLLVTLRRLDRGMPESKVRAALRRDLRAEFLAFAPPTPRRTANHRYDLPFEAGVPRRTLRTSEGAHGFKRVLLHAVDFEVPPGSAVLAAREGRVVRVVRGFDPREEAETHPHEDARHGARLNFVVVLHEDDTYATYQPLSQDIPVVEGDVVARGQRLGRTAELHDRGDPLVHFDVRRNGASAGSGGVVTPEPVRARFRDVGSDGIPLAGHAYESRSVPASPAPIAD